MSEKEIELWETTAKSGLLRSDSILRAGASKIRSDFMLILRQVMGIKFT